MWHGAWEKVVSKISIFQHTHVPRKNLESCRLVAAGLRSMIYTRSLSMTHPFIGKSWTVWMTQLASKGTTIHTRQGCWKSCSKHAIMRQLQRVSANLKKRSRTFWGENSSWLSTIRSDLILSGTMSPGSSERHLWAGIRSTASCGKSMPYKSKSKSFSCRT